MYITMYYSCGFRACTLSHPLPRLRPPLAVPIGRKQTSSVRPEIHYKLSFHTNFFSADDDNLDYTVLLQHTCSPSFILSSYWGPFQSAQYRRNAVCWTLFQSPTPTTITFKFRRLPKLLIRPSFCWGPPMPN